MEMKLKVLGDVVITEDVMNYELQNRFGRLAYSYQACGGGGGCGGCGGSRDRYTAEAVPGSEHTKES